MDDDLLSSLESPKQTIELFDGLERPENDGSPKTIEETRQYIRDFERLVAATATTRELYDKMLELYPDCLNLCALWTSARTAKPSIAV